MIGRVLRSAAPAAVLTTLAFVVALLFRPVSAEVAADAYVLVLAGIALLHLSSATTRAGRGARRSVYDQALEARPVEAERPLELTRIEREVALGVDSAFYAHYRLRPLLRGIAEQRFESRFASGVDEARPEIRDSLPADAWELFDPDRTPPRNPHGPGLERDRLAEIVDALERIEA